MSKPIVSADEQLIICVRQYHEFSKKTWEGSLEVDFGKSYTVEDILKLANDEPDSIVRVLKVEKYGTVVNITDDVLDYAEQQP